MGANRGTIGNPRFAPSTKPRQMTPREGDVPPPRRDNASAQGAHSIVTSPYRHSAVLARVLILLWMHLDKNREDPHYRSEVIKRDTA